MTKELPEESRISRPRPNARSQRHTGARRIGNCLYTAGASPTLVHAPAQQHSFRTVGLVEPGHPGLDGGFVPECPGCAGRDAPNAFSLKFCADAPNAIGACHVARHRFRSRARGRSASTPSAGPIGTCAVDGAVRTATEGSGL